MRKRLPLVLMFFAVLFLSRTRAEDFPDAPKVVQEIATQIQNKNMDEIRAIIVNKLGLPKRDIGSGISIDQWDVPDGVLTLHPMRGPTFVNSKTKKTVWLIRTTNSAGENLLQSYEMTTPPDPNNYGNCSWLGNLSFEADSAYQFNNSGLNTGQRNGPSGNFFMRYPKGKVAVQYISPNTAETLLESVAESAVIANLTFTSADGAHKETFSIKASTQSRRLDFYSEKPLSFVMYSSWKNFGK
jgi:hypothetical protein